MQFKVNAKALHKAINAVGIKPESYGRKKNRDLTPLYMTAIEAGELSPVGGTVVLRGGPNVVEVYGLGASKSCGDSMMDMRLGEMKLMRIPQQILLNQIEV